MGFMDKAKQRAQEAQRKLEESGALDKAKQAAQQAQQKIEERQEEIRRQSGSPAGGTEQAVRHDQHGRPIREEEPPAGAAPPPSAEPDEREAERPPGEDVNRTPDPFRPIQ